MNETVKVVIVFICGAVFGGAAGLVIRNIVSNAERSRMGSDSDVIGKIADGVNDATESVDGIENTAETIANTSGALADLVQCVDDRCQKSYEKE